MVVKWVHIVSSTFLFGTGIGSAFYLLSASLRREPRAAAFVARHVVIADWLFTATTMIVQPLTGLYLAHLAQLSLTTGWILWSFALFGIAAICWLVVVVLQMRMRDVAMRAAAQDEPLPPSYRFYFRCWILLGLPALFSFIAIYYLMVAKPL